MASTSVDVIRFTTQESERSKFLLSCWFCLVFILQGLRGVTPNAQAGPVSLRVRTGVTPFSLSKWATFFTQISGGRDTGNRLNLCWGGELRWQVSNRHAISFSTEVLRTSPKLQTDLILVDINGQAIGTVPIRVDWAFRGIPR